CPRHVSLPACSRMRPRIQLTARSRQACLSLLAVATVASAAPAHAQRLGALGPDVRKYLKASTSTIVLEHVEIIDGTGAAANADRNIVIDGGRISAITPGADLSPRDGATILDLRGYSVMPGIVGMHDHLFYMARPNLAADYGFDAPALFLEMSFS